MGDCPFCAKETWAVNNDRFGTVYVVPDGFPVTPLHYLIIPVRHCADYFDMTVQERHDADTALQAVRERVLQADDTVAGFNIGWNCGAAAGQTVPHAHGHLIPRRAGDVANPRGGVRGVIPARQQY